MDPQAKLFRRGFHAADNDSGDGVPGEGREGRSAVGFLNGEDRVLLRREIFEELLRGEGPAFAEMDFQRGALGSSIPKFGEEGGHALAVMVGRRRGGQGRFFFGGDVVIGGNMKARAALGALARLALERGGAMQPVSIGTEELDLSFLGAPSLGRLFHVGEARFGKFGLGDAWVRIDGGQGAHFGLVGDAKLHPTLGAFGDAAGLVRLTTDFVPVWAKKHDHGDHRFDGKGYWGGSPSNHPNKRTK
jgi:hypothetical protein